jgi:hypothetical protein
VRLRLAFPLCLMQRNGARRATGPEFGEEEVEREFGWSGEVWRVYCSARLCCAWPHRHLRNPGLYNHSVVLHRLHAIIGTLQTLKYSSVLFPRQN